MPVENHREGLLSAQEKRFFGDYTPEVFSEEERVILGYFFTNDNRPVFIARNLSPTMIGALIGRHSQTPDSMRRTLLRYAQESGREGLIDCINNYNNPERYLAVKRAEGLIERNFAQMGHDSLAATMNFTLGFERVSQLAAKAIEDVRLGLSPIERSTRYGFFGEKVNGKYQYVRPPRIMNSQYASIYEQAIDSALDLYVDLQERVAECYRRKFPDLPEKDIHRKVFDSTRVLLTAAIYTNIGISVNGQAAENMIIKLRSTPMDELQQLGMMIQEEIAKVCPPLMERVSGNYGEKAIAYLAGRREGTEILANTALEWVEPKISEYETQLISYDPKGQDKVTARILWEKSNMSYQQVLLQVGKMGDKDKLEIIEEDLGKRPDRRVRPSRAFEEPLMTFQIVCRFAEWRDLQRNRILTPSRQLLSYDWGIDVGEDLQGFGFGNDIEDGLDHLAETYRIIAREFPYDAQYLIAFGAKIPYLISLNFRELVHLAELRTGPGAHDSYARIASLMAKQACEKYPLLKDAFQFVNWRS